MTDHAVAKKPLLSRYTRRPLPRLAWCLGALAIAATLTACGGGGGDSTLVVNRPEMPGRPDVALPQLPLQRAQDSGNAPILYVGSNLHIGPDVAPAPDTLRRAARHGDITISHGTLADGIGEDVLVDYLERDTTLGRDEVNIFIPRFEPRPPTVRIAQGTTEAMRSEAIRAIQLINAALPRDWQIQVSNTPGTPGTAPPTNADILIQFLPREEWPDEFGEFTGTNVAGLSANRNTLERDSIEYQIVARSGRIFVDHTRTTGQHRMKTLVHEIIHSLGRVHPDPEIFPYTVMNTSGQSRHNHILYPLDRETLLAVYSRLQHDSTVASLVEDLGPWSDTSTHLLGEFSAGGEDVSFGVALRNGLAQPWATGPAPLTNLADNTALSGNASWSGRLLGFTPEAAPVAGATDLSIALDTLAGDLQFTDLEHWSTGQAPGAVGSGATWSNGSLTYDVEVRGNTFVRTAGDEGILTGAFLGTQHRAMGGTLQRDDLSAAFGGTR